MGRFLHIFAGLALCLTAWGQAASTSQISGTVQDATGSSVPGAQIRLVQTETGQDRVTTSGADGSYLFPNLTIGAYRMEVSKQGFASYIETGIVLNVNTNPTINPTLKIGAVSEQVTVQAEALAVETHSTGVGQVIDHREIVDLPLNAREPTQLLLLVG